MTFFDGFIGVVIAGFVFVLVVIAAYAFYEVVESWLPQK